MYADVMTESMRRAIDETDRRRAKQLAYNQEHGITPKSIVKAIDASLVEMYSPEWAIVPEIEAQAPGEEEFIPIHELPDRISELRREMMRAANDLDYEHAAELRDRIKVLERRVLGLDSKATAGSSGIASSQDAAGAARGNTPGRAGIKTPNKATASAPRAKAKKPASQGRLKLIPDPRN
jgi:hypothetical protein